MDRDDQPFEGLIRAMDKNPLRTFAIVANLADNNVGKPILLNKIGDLFLRRFRNSENLNDIDNSILAYKKAVNLMSPDDIRHLGFLHDFSVSCLLRYQLIGESGDVNQAIAALRTVIELTPDGHVHQVSRLTTLGNSFMLRFQYTGNLADIDQAIVIQNRVMELTHENNAERQERLNSLGSSLLLRFRHMGELSDVSEAISLLKQAVEHTPEGHTELQRRLSLNLGNSFLSRFERTGDLKDVGEAILIHQRSIDITPEGHFPNPNLLESLATSLYRRFQRTRNIRDADEAISLQQRAVSRTPENHASMPGSFHNLGTIFVDRFEISGDPSDIEEGISLQQKSINMTKNGHADLPGWTCSLGNSFLRRFEHSGNLKDIDEAISLQKKAVKLIHEDDGFLSNALNSLGNSFLRRLLSQHGTPDLVEIDETISIYRKVASVTPANHADLSGRLGNLGLCFIMRFQNTGDPKDINESINTLERAIMCAPRDHSYMSHWLNSLGESYFYRFRHNDDNADLKMAISKYRLSANLPIGTPSTRIHGARRWAELCHPFDPSQSLDAYRVAIELLPQVAWLGQTIAARHSKLADIPDLSSSAAAAAFSIGHYEAALEWLEGGRCIVWNQLHSLRTPLQSLRGVDAKLAEDFMRVSRELDTAASRHMGVAQSSNTEEQVYLHNKLRVHHNLVEEWNSLLEMIRINHFEDFLRPMKCSQILNGASALSGFVVVINVHPHRCDSLVLTNSSASSGLIHVPLPEFSHAQAENLRRGLHRCLAKYGIRMREARKGRLAPRSSSIDLDNENITYILSEIWWRVVKPILDALALKSPSSDPPRIWWCATGPLAFLPVHAAGIYGQKNQSTTGSGVVSDFVISSYIPTVSALLEHENPKNQTMPCKNFTGLLAVGQSTYQKLPPLPSTTEEIQFIREHFDSKNLNVVCLEGSTATVERVLQEMQTHSWIHFACHAMQDPNDPTNSAFYLDDDQLLHLSRIIKEPLPNADFSFLSACETGMGDEKLPEEAVHLAAGMLAVGYRSVVATMWPIFDEYAPTVTREVYLQMLLKNEDGDELGEGVRVPDSLNAARALRDATMRLREELGDCETSLVSWVPYIHLGK